MPLTRQPIFNSLSWKIITFIKTLKTEGGKQLPCFTPLHKWVRNCIIPSNCKRQLTIPYITVNAIKTLQMSVFVLENVHNNFISNKILKTDDISPKSLLITVWAPIAKSATNRKQVSLTRFFPWQFPDFWLIPWYFQVFYTPGHWRRQLWGTGAHAPSTYNNLIIFSVLLTYI